MLTLALKRLNTTNSLQNIGWCFCLSGDGNKVKIAANWALNQTVSEFQKRLYFKTEKTALVDNCFIFCKVINGLKSLCTDRRRPTFGHSASIASSIGKLRYILPATCSLFSPGTVQNFTKNGYVLLNCCFEVLF